MMAHRRKNAGAVCVEEERASAHVVPTVHDDAEKSSPRWDHLAKGEALSEIVFGMAPLMHISDSTEQLFIFMCLSKFMDTNSSERWSLVVREAALRLLVSFVTHHLISSVASACIKS